MTPQVPRTFQGKVIEHHSHYPSFRMEGSRQWLKMPFEHEGKRPAVGSVVTCTVASDGAIISMSTVKARSLRSRIIAANQ